MQFQKFYCFFNDYFDDGNSLGSMEEHHEWDPQEWAAMD